jgi:hypothetical protein
MPLRGNYWYLIAMWKKIRYLRLRKQITALAIAFGLLVRCHAVAASPVTQPCDLQPPSRLVAAIEFMDGRGSGSVTLVDKNGNELRFDYSAGVAHFKVNKGTKIESRAGSVEERCILDILRQGYKATFDSAPLKTSDAYSAEWFLRQHAMTH